VAQFQWGKQVAGVSKAYRLKMCGGKKASVAIERNGTIVLGMEWSNIRLLIAWAELC